MKKAFIIIILLSSFLIININSYVNAVSNTLNENIFRLHIIANSNSDEDQELKLKVRDEIISYMETISSNCKTKSEVIEITQKNIDEFYNIATSVISKNGFNYNVSIEIGEFYFPTKYYGNISMPAGMYDSLKIKIGDAQGENWWCSLFPALCFTDISSGLIDEKTKENLKENLDDEDFQIITSSSSQYKFKFKLIELLNEKNIL